MLKAFYKTLLVTVLSGSLLMLNFSYDKSFINFNSAKAETVHTSGASDEDLLATLTMVGVGVVASRLYKCKMTTDMMLAAAAGVAFLAGEVKSYQLLEKNIKDIDTQIQRDKAGRPTQAQIDLLKRLNDSYKEAMKTAEQKKSFQSMAQNAFLYAAVVAGYQYFSEMDLQAACTTGCTTASEAAYAACTASEGVSTCCAAPAILITIQGMRTGKMSKDLAVGLSSVVSASSNTMQTSITASETDVATICPAAAIGVAACKPLGAIELTTKGLCMTPPTANLSFLQKALYANVNYTPIAPVHHSNFFEKIFLQSAQADIFSGIGIASAAAVAFLMSETAGLGMQVDTYLFSPFNRAIVWGVLAGLTSLSIQSTDKQIKKLQSNIDNLDKIIREMDAMASGVHTASVNPNNTTSSSMTTSNPTISSTTTSNGNVNLGTALPCITGGTPANCPSFSARLNAQPGISGMPDFVQQQMHSLATVTDGINGQSTISGSTMNGVNSQGAQTNAIRAELAKQQKAMQKALGNKIDLAKETDKFRSNLLGIAQKELDNRKTTAGAMYASFGGGAATVATDAKKDKPKDVKKNSITAIPAVAIPAVAMPKMEDDAALKNNLAKEEKASEVVNAKTMDDYVIKNDITKDKETSIFELISNRYKTSGYPRLFKKLKE